MSYIIIALVAAAIGFFIGKDSNKVIIKRDKPPIIPAPRKKLTIKKGHLKPSYYGYKGGFANVNKCSKCDIIGLYEDMHTVDPCHECGGSVQRYTTSKWGVIDGERQWIPVETNNPKSTDKISL